MKIFNSLKIRLSLWIVGTLALISIIFSFVLYMSMAKNLLNGIDSSLETIAKKRQNDIMEGVEKSADGRIDAEEIEDIEKLDEMKNVFPLLYIQLLELSTEATRHNMKIIVKSNNLEENTLPLPQFKNGKVKQAGFRNFTDERLSESPLRLLSFSFKIDAGTYYILQFATSRKEVDETLGTLLMIILIINPIVLLLSFFGGYFLVHKTLSPVRSVVSSAKKITCEDLSHRIPAIGSRDEIGELVDTFNDMIARLDESFRQTKQFSSDASHEFKSPLTIIKGEVDLALRKKRFKKDYIKTLESISEEVESLQQIMDNLLFLGSTEAEGERIPFRKLSLDKVVLDVFEGIRKITGEKNTRFVLKKIDTIDMEGEITLLKRVIFNLFENAVKYTGDGGKVEILLEKQTGTAVFSITDTGIGIPADEIPCIFGRFYRVDKSRSQRMGSAGLGLSIVKQGILLHNGEIDVVSTPGKGSTFTVRLPLK
ncbi:MAG: HAMP domain-containing protein [bacterium]|nr:HAMP domain-containing protein [bacterium]